MRQYEKPFADNNSRAEPTAISTEKKVLATFVMFVGNPSLTRLSIIELPNQINCTCLVPF